MTLLSSLMQQLEDPTLTQSQRAELRCQVAIQLEETGNYKKASEALGELWQGVGARPSVEGLGTETAAEVLLRVGVLSGWIGSLSQIEGAQESAKNLISESIRLFESLSDVKKVLEARTELAYCYWREGAHDEARVILSDVLSQLTTDGELKAKAFLRLAIVESSSNRHSDALCMLMDAAPLFDKIHNQTVKGGYHNEVGLVLKNLAASERREDYLDRAFVEYAAASFHFEQAGHIPYCALVENNLGFLYFKAGKFTEAHEHLERARRLFSSLKDRGTAAQVDDTRARVFLAQGRNEEAERVAQGAVRALEKGGQQSLLAESMTTHGVALARLGQHDYARLTLFRAIEVAHRSGALNDAGLAALTVIEELSDHIGTDELQAVFERAYNWLITSQHQETLQRLLRVASHVLSIGRQGGRQDEASITLKESIRRYEGQLIRQALLKAEGSVTEAARMLGIYHQTLIHILNHRHTELLPDRTPAKPRKRSIVKKPKI